MKLYENGLVKSKKRGTESFSSAMSRKLIQTKHIEQ